MDTRNLLAILALIAVGCDSDPGVDAGPRMDAGYDAGFDSAVPPVEGVDVDVERVWQTSDTSCRYASPILVRSQGVDAILSMGIDGEIRLVDPSSGEDLWELQIEVTPPANKAVVLATPAYVADRWAVYGWAEINDSPYEVHGFYVGVLDLEERAIADEFPVLTVEASLPAYATDEDVVFDIGRAVNRSTIHHVDVPDRELGLAYVSYGNGPSVQPFHGWVFEVDLDQWRDLGVDEAFTGVLLTTAENDCGPRGNPMTMVCGGGVWNAAGPQIVDAPGGGYEIFVPTGNGRVDFDVGAYAHAVMRVGRGLEFDRACDETLCEPFDELDPDRGCLESCQNVFIPRLPEGEPMLEPESGRCDGATFLECYGELDADLGANAPVIFTVPGGPRVVVQPGKDGALYLIDAEHLGRMYQRLQVMDFCGTPEDQCEASWLGTFVTHPVVAEVDGDPVVILSGQMGDNTHPSGITAVRVVMDGDEPRMQIHWQVPDFDSEEALTAFRYQSGRPILYEVGGETFVFVVETRRGFFTRVPNIDPPGRLWGVRVRDGALVVRAPLSGAGQRYAVPLLVDDHLYVNSCDGSGWAEGRIDAYRIEVQE